ncbi:MAG TPA: UDP-N-acetylglucosamine 2-epimerase (non-hydrolyzing) [Longimicrobiales bacterium]|nr:UDP-N-acetylglucosamine 2-epimerase (non-hydrolyzing) [Longimicrobiales bacterium]
MKTLVVAGARPNFMKVAPILRVLRARGLPHVLVHTGQHYDDAMSDAFFRDLEIPAPDHHLGVGSESHAVQTARVMERFEPVLLTERPDWVLVAGDVNSTLACALVTAKLRHDLGCRLGHVEAGLRSHDWRMPEEVNRVLTDRVSDLLFLPSRDAYENLDAEGLPRDRARFVGNVMIDTLLSRLPAARERPILARLGLRQREYVAATVHRPSNVDGAAELSAVLRALGDVARVMPLVLPLHPRTAAAIARHGLEGLLEPLVVTEPLGYLDMLALLDGAACVLTDSGGIQEETTALGVPCVTLREQTERPITVIEGTNRLAPWPLSPGGVVKAFREALEDGAARSRRPDGWDGRAAERIVDALEARPAPV